MNANSGALDVAWEADPRDPQRTRLKDSASALLEQYAELLEVGKIHGNEVEQQVGEIRSSVLATGMVQSADKLMQLDSDLRRAALLSDHAKIVEEVASVTAAHATAADDGERRLRAVTAEMQAWLHTLEANYYACSVRSDEDVEDG